MSTKTIPSLIALFCALSLSACETGPETASQSSFATHQSKTSTWHLMLSHDRDGNVRAGSDKNIIDAVRSGCRIRIAWGGGRADPPRRSVEHVADVKWITVRNGERVSAQIGDFLINLTTLGEPPEEHPRREEFGGTQEVVHWRATLMTDGSFDAVWYKPHSGEFVTRRPQNHPMKWFADCRPGSPEPLYQVAEPE